MERNRRIYEDHNGARVEDLCEKIRFLLLRESCLIIDVYKSSNIRHIQIQILINTIKLFDLALYLGFIRFLYILSL